MKNIVILSLLLFVFSSLLWGQGEKKTPFEKGDLTGGLSLSLGSNSSKFLSGTSESNPTSSLDLLFLPFFFYALTPQIALGGYLPINYSSNKSTELSGEFTSNLFTMGILFAARYYLPCTGRIGAYGELALGPTFGNRTQEDIIGGSTNITKYGVSGFSAALALGAYLYLTSRLLLTADLGLLGYDTRTEKNKEFTDRKWVNNNFNFFLQSRSITLGLLFFLSAPRQIQTAL